jgi:hypothetical protein
MKNVEIQAQETRKPYGVVAERRIDELHDHKAAEHVSEKTACQRNRTARSVIKRMGRIIGVGDARDFSRPPTPFTLIP